MVESSGRAVILVVEDEPFVRMIAADVLAEHGMRVFEAGCVEEALMAIQKEDRIDLLFTDINMPGNLNGLDFAEIAHRQRPDLKLIVTSGGGGTWPRQKSPITGSSFPSPMTQANWHVLSKISLPQLANASSPNNLASEQLDAEG